jgi:hypothetical protein
MLNEQQVVVIYRAKLALNSQDDGQDTRHTTKGQRIRISVMYGVTSQTIRDIWSRRSWPALLVQGTCGMWILEQQFAVGHLIFILDGKILLIVI